MNDANDCAYLRLPLLTLELLVLFRHFPGHLFFGAGQAAGDETFSRAVEETREELTGYLRAETARQASQGRITMALCLAGAGLVILVLL